jgi:hypothetical protein
MKKLIIGILALISSVVYAAEDLPSELNSYLGIEAQAKQLKTDEHNMFLPGISLFGGCKLNQFVGLEAGGHLSLKKKHDTKWKHHGIHASVMGYVPLNDVSLVAGLGLSHIQMSAKSEDELTRYNLVSPRVSAGLVFHYTESLGTRYMMVWENHSKLIKEAIGISDNLHHHLGMFYTFN